MLTTTETTGHDGTADTNGTRLHDRQPHDVNDVWCRHTGKSLQCRGPRVGKWLCSVVNI